jgi:DNA-binding response OmpR family regulator
MIEDVLVVDAEEDARFFACRVLADEGHRTLGVATLDSARTVMLLHGPEIVLLSWDVQPGAFDKVALIEESRRQAMIVLASAHASVATIARRLGVRFVHKPFRPADLREAMRAGHDAPFDVVARS